MAWAVDLGNTFDVERVAVKWYGGAQLAVSPSIMDLGYPTYNASADDDLKAAAREVLEALKCLLYLMGEDAANPQQVKAYVHEAKNVLCALQARVNQDALPRPNFLQ